MITKVIVVKLPDNSYRIDAVSDTYGRSTLNFATDEDDLARKLQFTKQSEFHSRSMQKTYIKNQTPVEYENP